MEKIFLSAQERFFSREFPKKRLTEPGRPTIPLSRDAAVAQLDRATGYEPVGREFESLQPHQNFEGLMMNNHESFFRTRKSVPNLSAANRNRLMALLNAPSPFLPRRNPPSRIPPPRRHLLIGGLWGLKNRLPFKGKPFAHPIPLWLFPAWGDLARDSDRHPVHPPAHPYGFARFAYPRAVRPPRHVPRQRMGGGTAGMFCPRRAGGEMTEGKAAPPSPLRRPAEGVQGLEQAMARHAGDCDRAGGCRRIHAKRRALSHLACFLAVMPSCPILR